MAAKEEIKLITQNRKARHDYTVLDTLEAGIVLQGTEVKSLRQGRVNLKDSFARVDGGEMWLYHMHISPYDQGNRYNHDPTRRRKLLLHRREINRLVGRVQERGLTLIPLRVYLRGGKAKVELALARGKREYDRRHDIAKRDEERDMARALARRDR
jgi:SsrA-binding protein